jgi:hypothetical protein
MIAKSSPLARIHGIAEKYGRRHQSPSLEIKHPYLGGWPHGGACGPSSLHFPGNIASPKQTSRGSSCASCLSAKHSNIITGGQIKE